ncbi:MAG: biotin--[acetyl-CoA-carboxylase] ligase [Myxococcota bacterium]|nr:biotin--[acetyl-CoA-carboxylase] ligase [Myxococcota bacterium]MDW8363899.1 biotin--[acetyl-CoA-carboxylase] ligase [Myxococcales bacterium]
MSDPPPDLGRERIAAHLATRWVGRSLRVLGHVRSTQDEARADAATGAPDGHLVVADAQEAGRGSHGRSWSSPPGTDLYLSLLVRRIVAGADPAPLTLAVGCAVADTVESLGAGWRVDIKWPNDVLLEGRKCAGILVESDGMAPPRFIVGIGLNVNRSRFDPPLDTTATSLAQRAGRPFDRAAVLAELARCLEAWIERFVELGVEPVAAEVDRRLARRGATASLDGRRGRVLGVGPDGSLQVELDGVCRSVRTASIEWLEE